ncbi:MAG: hypothetical protein GY795_46590 [Desulfobacterales bacterium]|nr:hypothetical protein [Desulfobacterales bacterium]
MIKLKKSILSVLIFLVCLTFSGVFPVIADAGTPHIIYGTLRNSDDSTPSDSSVKFEGYIEGRPGEVLSESDTGCGYAGGIWWIETGNFPSQWSADEILHITIINTSINTKSTGKISLSNDGQQNVLLTLSQKDDSSDDDNDGSSVKGNAGETSGCFISAAGYEAQAGIPLYYWTVFFLFLSFFPVVLLSQSKSPVLVPTLCVGMQPGRSASRRFRCSVSRTFRHSRTRSVLTAFPRRAWERGSAVKIFDLLKILAVIIIFQSVFVTGYGKAFAGSVTFNLKAGLNAVSVPFEDSSITNVGEVLNTVPGCDLVKLWEPYAQKFIEYQKGSGADIPVFGKPVFVRVTADTDWQVAGEILAHPNFQLVKTGTTGVSAIYLPVARIDLANAESLCNEIPNCNTVWKWNSEKQGYEGHPKGSGINNFILTPGHSYLVNVAAEGTWTQVPFNEIDNDNDGFTENLGDCNDGDNAVYPGAPELCSNNKDNDCDGKTDCADSDCVGDSSCQTCTDADEDGFFVEIGCGEVPDCNDNDIAVSPGVTEICDNDTDNDCDGKTGCDDSDCSETFVCMGCVDADSDGYYSKESCSIGNDCNDNDAGTHIGAIDICGDGKDQDCDGADLSCPPVIASVIPVDNAADVDVDADIFAVFSEEMDPLSINRDTFYVQTGVGDNLKIIEGTVSYNGTVATFSPDPRLDYGTAYKAVVTTGVKNLAGSSAEADYIWSFATIPGDADKDGYTEEQGDCNDNNGTVHPGASENCNDNKDNDCDGNYDCADSECAGHYSCRVCTDHDYDGYYAESGCGEFADCNDYDKTVYPGATEICNDNKDNDCNVKSDCDDAACTNSQECRVCTDRDSDGYYAETDCGTIQDCNDYDIDVYPEAPEICNDNKDNDCDEKTDCDDSGCIEDPVCVTCTDADSDGFYAESDCGTVTDCDDEVKAVYPGAVEICGDEKDQNCNGTDLPCSVSPVVMSVSPGNNETDVNVNTEIIATFSQVMDSQSINNDTFYVRFGEGYNLQVIQGTVNYSGATAKFTPDSPLDRETVYEAVITAGAVNPGGTPVVSDYSWSFTTLPKPSDPDADDDGDGYTENQGDCKDFDADVFPGAPEICGDNRDQNCNGIDMSCDTVPSVKSVSPGDLAADVDVGTDINVFFSQVVDCLSVNGDSFYVRTGFEYGYETVPGTVDCSGAGAVFSPESPLDYGKIYEAVVTTGVKNVGGTLLESDYIWSFTTVSEAGADNDGDGYTKNQGDCNDNDGSVPIRSATLFMVNFGKK